MIHELKTVSPYWEAIVSGEKTFEIRYDDRCFQKGDIVTLKHYSQEFSCYLSASEPIRVEITYVCHFQQKEGWCVFGFKKLEKKGGGE